MTTPTATGGTATTATRCGCCGRMRPTARLVELCETPGVFICGGCAFWALRRPAAKGLIPAGRRLLALLGGRRNRPAFDGFARWAIPILASSDLDRTVAFYGRLGFSPAGRYDGYLLMHSGPVELHFTQAGEAVVPGSCFVHVGDATAWWKRAREQAVEASMPDETDYGLTEFVVTDPDGNRVRFGSPTQL